MATARRRPFSTEWRFLQPHGRPDYASWVASRIRWARKKGNSGTGILVYNFDAGKLAGGPSEDAPRAPEGGKRLQRSECETSRSLLAWRLCAGKGGDRLLVANNLSDEACFWTRLVRYRKGSISPSGRGSLRRCPSACRDQDGATGFVSLWNASRVAELIW